VCVLWSDIFKSHRAAARQLGRRSPVRDNGAVRVARASSLKCHDPDVHSGTCTAGQIRQLGGEPVWNTRSEWTRKR